MKKKALVGIVIVLLNILVFIFCNMAKWIIEHHKDLCIGCGACAAIEPKHWTMEGDKSHLIGSKKEESHADGMHEVKEVTELEGNQDAADACPVPCIFVKKNG